MPDPLDPTLEALSRDIEKDLGPDLTPEQRARIRAEVRAKFLAELDQAKASAPSRTEAKPKVPAKPPKPKEESFLRLSANLRFQHIILFTSCLILIVTGIPLKFHEAPWAEAFFALLGGIRLSRFLHRIAASGLIFVGAYHLLYTILSRTGRRDFVLLLPGLRDVLDFLVQIRYYLGASDRKARFARFSYVEKFDYWAVYWGMVIMIGSGLMLWFPTLTMRFLPKFAVDIAKEAHSDEGLLATLAIIIWHFYNVHLNPTVFPMSWIWLTGRITKRRMIEEHPLEYEQLTGQPAVEEEVPSAKE